MNKLENPFLISRYCLLITLGSFVLLSACKTKKGLPLKPKEELKSVVDLRPALQIYDKQQQNELKFNWFSTKADVTVVVDGQSQNFNAVIRIRKDSAIWISINPALGIEVARAIVTQDSIKVMNRMNNTYLADNICNIASIIKADLDYETLQNLLLGNSFEYYTDDRLKTSIEKDNYLLSSYRKKKLKTILNNPTTSQEPIQSIWIEPTHFKIVRLLLNEFASQRELDATYKDFRQVDSSWVAHGIDVAIKAQKNIQAQFTFDKVKLNVPQEMPFKIPAKYTRMTKENK